MSSRLAGLLAVAAVAALPAALPSAATAAAPNLSLAAAGGVASSSSALAGYPLAKAVDGARPADADVDYWNDGTQRAFPDWIAVSWPAAKSIGHVTLRTPVLARLTAPQRTLGRLTLQYLDGASWRAVATTNGQANPVTSWTTPTAADGSEIKQFYFAPVRTTSLRVLYDAGNSDGWSFLEEFETYASSQVQDYEESISYLRARSLQVEDGARLAGAGGTTIYAPDGVAHYQGQWTRDWEYAVEGYPEGMPVANMQASFAYQIARQRSDGQIPTLVTPGGDPIWGPHGVDDTDNAQFLVKAAWEIYRATGDIAQFSRWKTQLAAAMNGVPRNAVSHLVWIDPAAPHGSYGFTDSIKKTGDELFCSLLYREASLLLGKLYSADGDAVSAAAWTAKAADVQSGIATLWNATTGLFDSSSVDGQPDVWASAYAVVTGAATATQRTSIATWLRDHYDEVVQNGQIRHLPGGVFWRAVFPDGLALPGVYQNGGFWGTASGWVAYALDGVDEGLARQLVIDMARYYREVGPYEATNANLAYRAAGEYVASVTAPLAGLRAIDGPDLALAANGGAASSSSLHPSGTFTNAALNDGRRNGSPAYWNDGTASAFPDWAKVEWRSAQTLGKVILRLPVVPFLTAPARTIGRLTLQYWDGAAWVALAPLNGEANPVVGWTAPTVHDGRAVKAFVVAPVRTTAVRVLFDAGNSDGWSYLEELEAYAP